MQNQKIFGENIGDGYTDIVRSELTENLQKNKIEQLPI